MEAITTEELQKQYVIDGKLYRLTGRFAEARKPSGKVTLLVECIPESIYNTNPTNSNFNKWLAKNKLIHVQGEYVITKPKEEPKNDPT